MTLYFFYQGIVSLRKIGKRISKFKNIIAMPKKCGSTGFIMAAKKGKRTTVQGVPQSQTAALPRHQAEKETDKIKQVQIEQTYGMN